MYLFFHTFLHASPIALTLMRKTAFLSIELLTVTNFGKVSLVASGSSCGAPVGHSWTAGWSHLCFPTALSSPRMGFQVHRDTSWALRQHKSKLPPRAGLILSGLPWQITGFFTGSFGWDAVVFRKTKYITFNFFQSKDLHNSEKLVKSLK